VLAQTLPELYLPYRIEKKETKILWYGVPAFICLILIVPLFPFRESTPFETEDVAIVDVKEEPPPVQEPEPPPPQNVVTEKEPPQAEPPPPVQTEQQFGLPDEATDDAGGMDVATGNTLMVPADTIVKPAPPPLPAAEPYVNVKAIRDAYISELAVLLQNRKKYPRMARKLRQQGVVLVRFTIEIDGQITNVSVTAASPFELLNDAARQTVEQLSFYKPIPDALQVPKLVITVPVNYEVN